MAKDEDRAQELEELEGKGPSLWGILGLVVGGALLISLALGVGVLFALALYVHQLAQEVPPVEALSELRPGLSSQVFDRKGRLITELFVEKRQWVRLEEVSPYLIKSVLAAEDADFYRHAGVNPMAIARAALRILASGRVTQGGSTITQQLARNVFLTPERTLTRKLKEAMLAVQMERRFSKDEILEMYVNQIYLGHGRYGVLSASRFYFGKHPRDLTLAEAAMLAGLIASPENYSPRRHWLRAKNRQRYVIERLRDLGWISNDEAEMALREEIKLHEGAEEATNLNNRAPHFVSYLLFEQLLPRYGADVVYKGGLKVYTTLDLDVQAAAEEAVRELPGEGALVALDPSTGAIVAMVGGKDFSRSKFNRATQAYRQPGSAFKVVLYTAAVDGGLSPNDELLDEEITFENGWSPRNFDNKFHGTVTVVEALEQSYNAAAVRLAQEVGVGKILDYARKLGINSPHLPRDLSLALGSCSVTPMEMAAVFCAIANGGNRVSPFGITRVEDSSGVALEEGGPRIERAIPEVTAYLMLDLLRHVVESGTAWRAKIPGYQVFGKTGTTNDFVSSWFIGGVPGLVTAIYTGHDDNKPLGDMQTGGIVVAPIWRKFTQKALAFQPSPKAFPVPPGISFVQVCAKSGALPTPSCPRITTVAVREGEEPEHSCPLHGAYRPSAPERIEDVPLAPPVPIDSPRPSQEVRPAPREKDVDRRLEELLRRYGIKR